MKKRLLTALALALPITAQADVIGLTAGAYSWQQNWEGDVQSEQLGSNKVDLEDDLGYDDERNNSFFIAFEHPVPVLPNIRLQHTELEIDETNTLSRTITYEGNTYPVNTTVDSKTDLTHTDATFYYEILDNIVSLDLGLTARYFDGEVRIAGSGQSASSDLQGAVPLVFVGARADLPLTGLYAIGELQAMSYDGNSLRDLSVGVGYEIMLVGLELGYRNFDVDLEGDDDEEANLTVDGYFLGVKVDF